MEDVLVRELPPKSSVDINDYVVMEDYDGTKIAKLEDIKTAIASHLYFNSLDDVLEASLNEGDVCIALGRYEMNDGGCGIYKIVNNPALVEDKVLVFYLNTSDTLRAVLIHDGTINVHQAGAYGDGVHDDLAAIHRALKTKLNVTFGKNKTYLCNGQLEISNIIDSSVKSFNQTIDFNGSKIFRTTNGYGIKITTVYDDIFNEGFGYLNPGNFVIKNIGGIEFSDSNIGMYYIDICGENITLENINIEIKNPNNNSTGNIGLSVHASKNIYVNGLDITRVINNSTEKYTYNEYVKYLMDMNFSGKNLFTLLDGNVPDYNNGKVLKIQTGIGIDIYTSSDYNMSNIIFNNITLNKLSKGVNIHSSNIGLINNVKFNNICINGTELSEFQGRMIESIEATGDDESPYTITYKTLTTEQTKAIGQRKGTKVFISKYTDKNAFPTEAISCGFYLDFAERNTIDIENLYMSNVANGFYFTTNTNTNSINITNFTYYNDTLKNIGGASTDPSYIYDSIGIRDSFSVIYNYNAINNNIINLYGTHRYGGNNSKYEYKLPTSYIFGLDSKVNNYGTIETYGINCNKNLFTGDILNGSSVINNLPVISEMASLSKPYKKISISDIGYQYSNGGFLDLLSLNPSGDTNVYFASNVNKPIRYIGTKVPIVFESNLPVATATNSYSKNINFSYTYNSSTVNAKLKIKYDIIRNSNNVDIDLAPIFTGVPTNPRVDIKVGFSVNSAEEVFVYPFDTSGNVETEKVRVALSTDVVSDIVYKLYINDTVKYQSSFRVYGNSEGDGLNNMILNPFDRQVIRLTAPINMIIESYDVEPDNSVLDKCVFKYQGNIKLKNDIKSKNLDPNIPTVLQFNKSSGIWYEI